MPVVDHFMKKEHTKYMKALKTIQKGRWSELKGGKGKGRKE